MQGRTVKQGVKLAALLARNAPAAVAGLMREKPDVADGPHSSGSGLPNISYLMSQRESPTESVDHAVGNPRWTDDSGRQINDAHRIARFPRMSRMPDPARINARLPLPGDSPPTPFSPARGQRDGASETTEQSCSGIGRAPPRVGAPEQAITSAVAWAPGQQAPSRR